MQCHELTQIMCQMDMYFAEALNRIQICTPEEGSEEDLMLKKCELAVGPDIDSYP